MLALLAITLCFGAAGKSRLLRNLSACRPVLTQHLLQDYCSSSA